MATKPSAKAPAETPAFTLGTTDIATLTTAEIEDEVTTLAAAVRETPDSLTGAMVDRFHALQRAADRLADFRQRLSLS